MQKRNNNPSITQLTNYKKFPQSLHLLFLRMAPIKYRIQRSKKKLVLLCICVNENINITNVVFRT